MKTAIIGAGPSGLYLAILLVRWGVTDDITVYEQNPKDATYGFGVALMEGAVTQFAEADAASCEALQKEFYLCGTQDIENPDGSVQLAFPVSIGAIPRLALLNVLQAQCDALGVAVHYGARIDELSQFDDCDLVVGADGANSFVRRSLEDAFGTERETLKNCFAWYGVEMALNSGLRFRRRGDGVAIAHYYPYTPSMSTFLVEFDENAWRDCDMEGKSDAERKKLSEEIFEDVLEGRELVENKSIWTRFKTVRNRNWSAGRVVLLGDALYRAHFSIGSGTRLAMEDTIALAKALKASPADVPAALAAFQRERAPKKQVLMSAAEKSYTWYDNVRDVIDMPILDFAYNFLTRTGRMPEERLRMFLPDFMAAYDNRDRVEEKPSVSV